MERALSPDERIRRAEEIYYRRKVQSGSKDIARVSVSDKRSYYLLQKMVLQIVICILLYCIIYLVQTTDYVFSGDVITTAREVLSYDMDFQGMYDSLNEYINGFIFVPEDEKEEDENENIQEDVYNEELNEESESLEETGEGGQEIEVADEEQYLSQMEVDAMEIRENYSLIIPLKGTITSRFGNRNPTSPNVPRYHTGIDIAASPGTVIIASHSGVVELVSSARRLSEII